MKLIDIRFSEDKKYILAEYEEDRKDGLYLHSFKIPISFYPNGPLITANYDYFIRDKIDFGFGYIDIEGKMERTLKLIKPRVEEMTIADIEKELGYKVKLVSEEKECVNRADD